MGEDGGICVLIDPQIGSVYLEEDCGVWGNKDAFMAQQWKVCRHYCIFFMLIDGWIDRYKNTRY